MYPQSKFWSKYENSKNNATENFHFYRSEKWLYVASSCFRNDEVQMVGSQSIRTHVNSYSSQFVLILVNSYSKFWSIRTHLVNSYSCLVSSYSFW